MIEPIGRVARRGPGITAIDSPPALPRVEREEERERPEPREGRRRPPRRPPPPDDGRLHVDVQA